MQHFCYHIVTDHHDHYQTTLEETKKIVAKCKDEGDSDFHVYLITTEEIDDEILVDEVSVQLDQILKN
jgi:pyruvate formate-lyase activating enzyme-like uncharacterized protein